jgi:Tfp pilus assembly protein PilF
LKFKYFNSVTCFCLTWALAVLPAQAQDTHSPQGQALLVHSLPISRQSHKEDARSLSHYITGVYYENLGDLDRALGEYRKALEIDPGSSLLHFNLASVFIQKNNPAQAVKELKRSIELDPQAVQSHALLALVYATQDKADLATGEYLLALENARKSDPENIDIYKDLGLIYLQQKKSKQAEGIFKLILNLAPADPEAHFYLGSIYYDLKDYSSVEKELKIAVKLKPDFHEALNFLGYFYLEQDKNIDQAGVMIKQALALDPENGAYIDSLGWFYFKKENFKEALSHLEKAASLLIDPEIYDHLGDVYLKLGDSNKAKLNWEKSLKLDAQQDKVKAKLFKLTRDDK